MAEEPEAAGESDGRDPLVIDTTTGRAHGRDNCPQCGSTDVGPIPGAMGLRCSFCRYEWVGTRLEEVHGLGDGIDALAGRVMTSGAADITSDETILTVKCQACGAEVVIDTARTLETRCHWCRHVLSINDKIPNGAVPDGILPFAVSRDDAMNRIRDFVGKRKFFALKRFKAEFKADNVLSVYLPYMTVDGNLHCQLFGRGEVQTRRYTVRTGKNSSTTYYDANSYEVVRVFDMHVDDLILESSATKADFDSKVSTNNIINSILPFDVKNMVAFDSNYLQGSTAEKRDLNVDSVARAAHTGFLTMARESARRDVRGYDRGVHFTHEQMTVHGSRWATVFLPVWLYSYAERQGDGRLMVHYIAVNGRTGATMGSVPINKGRLAGMTALIGVVSAMFAWPMAVAVFLS